MTVSTKVILGIRNSEMLQIYIFIDIKLIMVTEFKIAAIFMEDACRTKLKQYTLL